MKSKMVSWIILTLLLISVLSLASYIQSVKASGTIYIRSDGSVDPPTAPISSVDNLTYTFTGNISESIVVERDNIVVDGASYTLRGFGSEKGITLNGRSNVTIKNMNIKDFGIGIMIDAGGAEKCIISENTIKDSVFGIVSFLLPMLWKLKQWIVTFCGDLHATRIRSSNVTRDKLKKAFPDLFE